MKFMAATLALGCCVTAQAMPPSASRPTSRSSEARFVAEHLDVMSIPGSIYARQRPGAHTLKDYGFTDFEAADGGVRSIDQSRQWLFGLKIIEDNGGIKVLCILDGPFDGTTSGSQNAFEVKLGADGLFHGTGRILQSDQCLPFQP